MSERAPLSTALASLQAALRDAPTVRGVAFFGSAREGRTWAHSDIDLIVVVDQDGEHWESRMLWWEGWEVHFQTLSVGSFQETAGVNRGSGLARALGSADVWFDRGGELTAACALLSRMDPNARDLAVLRSTARAVEALHEAERHVCFGRDRKGRVALMGALEHVCALRVAESGVLPPREPWDAPGPERDQVDALLAGAAVGPILQDAWETVRARLGGRCAAMLQLVGREGPLGTDALGKVPLFIGVPFSERLMAELVDAGLLARTTEADSATGLPVLRFERTKKGKPDVFPAGDASLHLDRETIEAALAARPAAPRDEGRVVKVVYRVRGGARALPEKGFLSTENGMEGDAWQRRRKHKPLEQVAVMEASVAEVLANGQAIEILGDNLFVDLDLSEANLPPGTRLRVGAAEVVVTPEPHDGCNKLAARVGKAAMAAVADKALRSQNRRGVYWRVVLDGAVAVGDRIVVLERPAEG